VSAVADLREVIVILADLLADEPVRGPAPEMQAEAAAERMEDYAWARAGGDGPVRAAGRVGLRPRMARKYEARLRSQREREAA